MRRSWMDIVVVRVIKAIRAKTDNLPAAPADQSILAAAIQANLDEIHLHDEHFHNREYWFGKSADQSGNNWGTRASLTPYSAISGLNDFGGDPNDEAKVIGSDDTPFRAGSTEFDFRRFQVVAVSSSTVYLLRIIHGTGTMTAAESAGQYTEIPYFKESASGRGSPLDIVQEKVPVGQKIWIRAKNASDNATIDFIVGLHEYPLA